MGSTKPSEARPLTLSSNITQIAEDGRDIIYSELKIACGQDNIVYGRVPS